jgi:hypothetical protein
MSYQHPALNLLQNNQKQEYSVEENKVAIN